MIFYSKPFIKRDDTEAVMKALSRGNVQGNGEICKKVENRIRKLLDAHSVFLTTSGTHALEGALMSLDIKHGDEVICPSFTFVSTANAIIRQGARPVFAEIDKATLNIDIDDALKRITRRTKAIVPVHYAGFSCDMERLVRVASERNIHIVEDAAQAIGAKYNGRHLGTFGDFGCFSFHSTKNIICGEGGAIVVNNRKFDERIQIVREKGTNRFLFLDGKIEKYTWVDAGSSFVISDILAAFLSAQFDKLSFVNKKRRAIFEMYMKGLKRLEKRELISLPHPEKRSQGNGHIFWILLRGDISQKLFIESLKKKGIECTHHYVPLHSSPFGIKRLGYKKSDLPITEYAAAQLVRLPLHPYLKEKEIDYIIENIYDVLTNRIDHVRKA